MQNQASHQMATKTDHGKTDYSGIEFGNDLSRVVPSELMMWSTEEYEDIYDIRFLNGQLMQYSQDGEDAKELGPGVFCMDSSGSMMGSPLMEARGFMMALLMKFRKEGRKFYVVEFGGKGEFKTTEVKDENDIIDVLCAFMDSGSTCFETPLREALRIIGTAPNMSKADIIFLTDGAAEVSASTLAEIQAEKNRLELKIIGTVVGMGTTSSVTGFCDKAFKIRSFFNHGDDAEKLFREVF
jgi:uncharacterized protein with von Willebrand factor type A (vWA) domain